MEDRRDQFTPALETAARHALAFLSGLEQSPVSATRDLADLRARIDKPLSHEGLPADTVLNELVRDVEGGILGCARGRFFGWVIGGSCPAALGADWLTASWDQNAALYACGPAAAVVEEVAGKWLKELFSLPSTASFAFVSGCQMPPSVALAPFQTSKYFPNRSKTRAWSDSSRRRPDATDADHDRWTDDVIAWVLKTGETFFGGTTWQRQRAMRVLDLAEIVGPTGQVVAVDKSRRFLDVLDAATRQRGITNVSVHELDLDAEELPDVKADGAWCRWVLTFVAQPREVLERVCGALKPGGVLVIHEYFDYSTWQTAPRCVEVEEFVSAVMASWKAIGGEPDVGLVLPQWLRDLGFDIVTRPIIDIVPPADQMWLWLRTFMQSGRHRLVDTGYLSQARAEAIWNAVVEREQVPGALMITPGVIELTAIRRCNS